MSRSMPDGGYAWRMDMRLALGAFGMVIVVRALVFGMAAIARWSHSRIARIDRWGV
jgi:hypothetical protein